MSAELRAELAALAEGRDLSGEAAADLTRLLAEGTDSEVREVISHLRHLPAVRTEVVDVCPETTARFVERRTESAKRQAAHRRRLTRTASWLGREVGAYRLVMAEAEQQLDRLVEQLDPEHAAVSVPLVSRAEGRLIARREFHRARRAAARQEGAPT